MQLPCHGSAEPAAALFDFNFRILNQVVEQKSRLAPENDDGLAGLGCQKPEIGVPVAIVNGTQGSSSQRVPSYFCVSPRIRLIARQDLPYIFYKYL